MGTKSDHTFCDNFTLRTCGNGTEPPTITFEARDNSDPAGKVCTSLYGSTQLTWWQAKALRDLLTQALERGPGSRG